jgi:hypothetical protein
MRERIRGLVVLFRVRLAAERASFATPCRPMGRTGSDCIRFPDPTRPSSRTAPDQPRFPRLIRRSSALRPLRDPAQATGPSSLIAKRDPHRARRPRARWRGRQAARAGGPRLRRSGAAPERSGGADGESSQRVTNANAPDRPVNTAAPLHPPPSLPSNSLRQSLDFCSVTWIPCGPSEAIGVDRFIGQVDGIGPFVHLFGERPGI